MFRNSNKEELVSGIDKFGQEENTPTSDPEDPFPVHLIPYEG